jgi:hypothetical protein
MRNHPRRRTLLAAFLVFISIFVGFLILSLDHHHHNEGLISFNNHITGKTITEIMNELPSEQSEKEAISRQIEPKTWIDKLELPVPQDTASLARYYGTQGRRNFSDVQVVWQKQTDKYIDFLKEETFSQGAYRTYMKSELIQVMGETFTSSPYDTEIISLICRTRRLSKLIDYIDNAKKTGTLNSAINDLSTATNRFMKEVSEVEDKLGKLAEEEPEIFQPSAPEEQRSRFIDLSRGYALSGLDVDEKGIPMSLDGAAHGLAANSFLLGLTEDPLAVAPLLKIASYDNVEFQKKIKAVMDNDNFKQEIVLPNSLANFIVVGDALDRILVSCANRQKDNLSLSAKAVAGQYVKWRTEQNFPERKVFEVYPWDAPQNPYHFSSSITGRVTKVETMKVLLPLHLAKRVPHTPFDEQGTNPVIETILDWAKRFQAALDKN